jgi:hypothetical protein
LEINTHTQNNNFLCYNFEREGNGIISRLNKHALLFSSQKEPEVMIDRNNTLTMISQNKKVMRAKYSN